MSKIHTVDSVAADLAHEKRCVRLREMMIESGQIVPKPPGPKLMTVEQVQAWKARLLKLGAWTPMLLKQTPRGYRQ